MTALPLDVSTLDGMTELTEDEFRELVLDPWLALFDEPTTD